MFREPKPRLDGLNDALGAWLGALNRSRMFDVTLRPMVLATLWSQLQKPVLKPLSTAKDHWIVPAEDRRAARRGVQRGVGPGVHAVVRCRHERVPHLLDTRRVVLDVRRQRGCVHRALVELVADHAGERVLARTARDDVRLAVSDVRHQPGPRVDPAVRVVHEVRARRRDAVLHHAENRVLGLRRRQIPVLDRAVVQGSLAGVDAAQRRTRAVRGPGDFRVDVVCAEEREVGAPGDPGLQGRAHPVGVVLVMPRVDHDAVPEQEIRIGLELRVGHVRHVVTVGLHPARPACRVACSSRRCCHT